jgi:hypothetical protein
MRAPLALVLALAGFVSACVHLKSVYLPSGELGYIVACPGTPDPSDCYNRAHDTCGGPYFIFSQNDDPAHREVTFSCPRPRAVGAPNPGY